MNPFQVVKICGCGREHTHQGWLALEFIGVQVFEAEQLELRGCPCGSSIARVIHRNVELPVDPPEAA